jgi:hypothetical protein
MNQVAVILLFFCFFISGHDERYITWSSTVPLTWGDFQGRPHLHSSVGAVTMSGISLKYEGTEGALVATVKATFDREESWVNRKAADDYVLKHEQLHFDITELYARKLRAALKQINPGVPKPEKVVERLFDRYSGESRTYQDLYDKETDHSRNVKQQAVWEERINRELNLMVSDTALMVMIGH